MMNKETLVTKDMRKLIKDLALEQLKKCDIHELPVNLVSIVKLNNWNLISLSKAIIFGLLPADINHEKFNGAVMLKNNSTIIIYNETHPASRRRWTIAHEIAHIILNHTEQSSMAEAEANYFARQLLMPLAVLDEIGAHTAEDISEVCNVSMEAATIREKDFERRNKFKNKYGNTRHDIAFLRQFGMYEFSKELAM